MRSAEPLGAPRPGPHRPLAGTPARAARSVRRTSTVDTTRPDGILGRVVFDARARDLLTGPDGTATELGRCSLQAVADAEHRALQEIVEDPPGPALDGLLGATVGPGFRARVDEVLPDERDTLSLRYLLLDDLPGASLVSGYAIQRAREHEPPGDVDDTRFDDGIQREDLCAGWAADATIMVQLRATGQTPMVRGPLAPALERADDDTAWHAVAPLPPHGMRRRRRLDLREGPEGGPLLLDVHFRDSHVDGSGTETVVHEYRLDGALDPETGRIVALQATAQVLPWVECPNAVGSAARLVGEPVRGLRPRVRATFLGPSTCTHLNDTMRGLADLEVLARALRGVKIAPPPR